MVVLAGRRSRAQGDRAEQEVAALPARNTEALGVAQQSRVQIREQESEGWGGKHTVVAEPRWRTGRDSNGWESAEQGGENSIHSW